MCHQLPPPGFLLWGMGVGSRGGCGQDFLERGDPDVWGKVVILGLKPRCQTHTTQQAHNSRETQHSPTTPLQHNTGTQISFPHSSTLEPRQMSQAHHSGLVGSVRTSTGTKDSQAHSRHVTQAGTLGYTQETDTPRHKQTNTSWEYMDTQDVSGWGTQIQPHPQHTEDNGVPGAPAINKLIWPNTEAVMEGTAALVCQTPTRIPCPALGNSKAHMTQGEGFWNSLRRNCIILTNDPFPPQGIKAQ